MAIEVARYDNDTAFRAVCAAAVVKGQLVGLNSSGQLVLADADAGTPVEAVGFALVDGAVGDTIGVGTQGELKDSTWAFTAGQKLWTSGTAGGVTATRPSTATNLVQPVGFAKAATRVILNITPASAVVQAAGTTTVAFA